MSRQTITDRRGRPLGYIDTGRDGEQRAIGGAGQVLARFNPRTDETFDTAGQRIAYGNQLAGLVRRA